MTSRRLILPALAAAAVLPWLSVPAEAGGAVPKQQPIKTPPPAWLHSSNSDLKNAVALLGKTRGEMGKALKKNDALNASARGHVATALKAVREGGAANADKVESIRKALDAAMKDLEAQDRMGNFEIQRLMSAFNQAETLASNVQKKMDDTISGQQQKIG
ncbi:MAG TPA: hypothetical protein VGT02_03235 [Methylomirabilota bacterium]|jgi:hypothetical protein|nr:hypothetical protein [Methylomirabilota bacterium]